MAKRASTRKGRAPSGAGGPTRQPAGAATRPRGNSVGATASDDGARDLVHGYLAAYAKRADGQANRAPFSSDDTNALVAILHVEIGRATKSVAGRAKMLEAVHTLSSAVSVPPPHGLHADILGAAWAAAYGELPLESPPVAALTATLESGSASGSVAGTYHAAWRALFWPGPSRCCRFP